MAQQIEINFMNDLPASLRVVAQELYLKESVDVLVESRLKGVSEKYQEAYSLNETQWNTILNALILTKFSKLHLGHHLTTEHLTQLNYMVKVALDRQDVSCEEIVVFLEEHANTFAKWYKELLKLIRH
ncbi:MAG: hypothetical protein R3254_06115 [Thiomicrorhabdus sp.]|nr:hypothetical protein [Thiomicrorhabdus sp.]